MPTYNSSPELLSQAVASVVGQSCLDWELIIVDDGSSLRAHHDTMEYWRNRDRRIKVLYLARNGNISVATNAAAALAEGEFLVFLDHDDLLHPDALDHLALRLDAEPEADLIYTDDDKISVDGKRHSPQFKPDWSPELLLVILLRGASQGRSRLAFPSAGGDAGRVRGLARSRFFPPRRRACPRGRSHSPGALSLARASRIDGRRWSRQAASLRGGPRAVAEAFQRRGVACEVVQPDWSLRDGCAIFEPVMPDDGPSVAMVIIVSDGRTRGRQALEFAGPDHVSKFQGIRD